MAPRLSPQERVLRSITEAQFQKTVIEMAELFRWRWYHAPENRPVAGRSGTYIQNVRKGFPDLVLVKGDRLIFAELKRELGPLQPGQQDWLDAVRAAGAEAYLWRPSNMAQVREVLGR